MNLIQSLQADFGILDRLDEADEVVDRSGKLTDDIGERHHHTQRHIAMNDVTGCDERNEDIDLDDKVTELPEDRTIRVEHVTFSYDGAERNYALNDVSLEIPERKVTAIVGESGCGKTTLILLPTILPLTAILWMRLDFIRRQRWLM